MIDKNKEYKTKDGREVRIYATDGCEEYPIHGAILSLDGWRFVSWSEKGEYKIGAKRNRDLIEVKKTETIYIHVVKCWKKEDVTDVWVGGHIYSKRFNTIEEIIEHVGISRESELIEVIEKTYEV